MINILVDHNIEGQAEIMWGMLEAEGWLEVFQLQLLKFKQVGLPDNSSDQYVWRFAQKNGMVLLTANRRMKEEGSLEQTIREENTSTSLPVFTISNANRLFDRSYRERCAFRLLEICFDLNDFLGVGRIFIP